MSFFSGVKIDLKPELLVAIQTGEVMLQRKAVKLNADIDPALALITCDRRRIRQVLLNLISNACKFTEEGSITLRVHNSELREIQAAGFDGFLGKPLQPHQFADQLARILRHEPVWEF